MAAVGAQQPGDHGEDARLARPRRPEQRGEAGSGREPRRDDAVAPPLFDVDLNRHAAPVRHGCGAPAPPTRPARRSEEHTSELQSLMRISYAVFCLKKNKTQL